jgi:predicted TIM-barrel enzyme
MSIEVFPVVHIQRPNQALEQSEAAFAAGADGVYLIDHNNGHPEVLLDAFNQVAATHPGRFVGVNFLQHGSARQSLQVLRERVDTGDIVRLPSGLWSDDADANKDMAQQLRDEDPQLAGISYLGGVAFKYTRFFTDDPERATTEAIRLSPFVDVVTTSGAGTGKAPNPEKIRAMKRAIGQQRLAIASGISVDNLHQYSGSFDQLLVSTSVETEPYSGVFDEVKLKDLIDMAHES